MIREAHQHGWCDHLKYECGGGPGERAKGMMIVALEQPDWARSRWNWLLATDGLRSDPWTRVAASPADLEWTPLRQQWEDENYPLEKPTGDEALRRDAYRYLEEFFELNQLAVIDLMDEVFSRSKDRTTYFADFTIIDSPFTGKFYPLVVRSGVIQSRFDPKLSSTFDTAVFKRVDEVDD